MRSLVWPTGAFASHRLLLEWETAQAAHSRARNQHRQFVLARIVDSGGRRFCFSSPPRSRADVGRLGHGPVPDSVDSFPAGSGSDQSPGDDCARRNFDDSLIARCLRTTARRTWRYFDEFVGPQTHWLPPDNVQETPTREIFLRTSPTNIGLWMLATVAANDFGYSRSTTW